MPSESVGRVGLTKARWKLVVADLLNLHEEPVFSCPCDGCDYTGNYGREIWIHLFDEHHRRVVEP